MNTHDWEDRVRPADETSVGYEQFLSSGSDVEELLAINWLLVLQIEQEYEEQREFIRQFEEDLDELFALIHSPELPQDESPDPPGWPAL